MKIKKIDVWFFSLFTFSLPVCVTAIFHQSMAADDDYAGIDVCRTCHQKNYDNYLKSTRSKASIPGNPANKNASIKWPTVKWSYQ